MNFEAWIRATLKTICVTSIPFTLYFTTASTLSITVQNFTGVLFIAFIVLLFFCLYSLAGWLLFGLPLHWLISKQLNNNKAFYPIAILLLWLGLFLYSDARSATISAIVASFQLLLFLYWLKGSPKDSLVNS